MAKEQKDLEFVTSGRYLFETRKNRDVIPLSMSADIGFGKGIPLGCTVLFGGKAKSGKSTVALQYGANAQRLYKAKVFFCNIEGRLDNKLLSQIQGIDLDNLEIIMGPPIYDKDDKEKIIGHSKMPSQKWFDIIGNLIINNPKSVIIVDSIAAMSDEAELAEDMGHQSRGFQQRLESQFVRKFGDLVVPSQVTLFLLTQIQANTSGYGETIQMKCGNAIRHMADAIVFIKSVEKWKPSGSNDRILGQDINCRIDCSPFGPPFVETVIPLRFGYGVDTPLDLARSGVTWGFIKAEGAWFTLPFEKDEKPKIVEINKENKKLIKVQGEENLRKWFVENKEHMELMSDSIRKMILG